MKKKLILLLLTLTLCSFNLPKVKAETINWKAMKLYNSEKQVFRRYTTKDGETKRSDNNIAYIYMGNNTIYCIEMEKEIAPDLTKGTATTKLINPLNSYFTKNPEITVGKKKIKVKVLDAVALLSKFGTEFYNERKEQNLPTNMNKFYLATQAMIWQYLSEAGVYGDSIKGDIEIIYYKNGKPEVIDFSKYKDKLIKKIYEFYTYPNIQGTTMAKLNENKYEFTLTDDNEVLNKFEMKVKTDGVDCSKSNNTITCSFPKAEEPTKPEPTSVEFEFTKNSTGTNDKVFKVDDKYQATLLMDKTPTITSNKIVNLGVTKHRLEILKTDSEDNKTPLEGVTYQICNNTDADCNNPFDTQTTKKDGKIIFNDLDETTYYIKEIETIEGYVLDEAVKKIEIKTSDTEKYNADTLTYSVTYTNTKEKINGYIQINKTDKADNKPLEGITFDVYDENDKVIETIKTNKDGKAKTKLLPKGLYYVKEKEPLKDYLLIEEEQVVTINENNKTYELSFVNEKVVPTGDSNILLLITIAACTLICAIIIYIKKINLVKNNTN